MSLSVVKEMCCDNASVPVASATSVSSVCTDPKPFLPINPTLHRFKPTNVLLPKPVPFVYYSNSSSDEFYVVPPNPPLVGIEKNPGPPFMPRLVGIELNPGPDKKQKQKQKKSNKLIGSAMPATNRGQRLPNTNVLVRSTRPRQVIVSNTEQIAIQTIITTFESSNFLSINPGDPVYFPYLSTVAGNYGKYIFRSLRFIYKPTVSAFSTLGQTGRLIMSFNYDAGDPPPTSLARATQSYCKAECMPYESMTLDIDCSQFRETQDSFYVRGEHIPTGMDPKTYDCGSLCFNLSPGGAGGVIGDIYAQYEIELFNPINSITNLNTQNRTVWSANFVSSSLTSGVSTNLMGPLHAWTVVASPIPSYMTNANTFNTDTFIGLHAGTFLVVCNIKNINAGGLTTGHDGTLFVGGATVNGWLSENLEAGTGYGRYASTVSFCRPIFISTDNTSINLYSMLLYTGAAQTVTGNLSIIAV